MWCRSCDFIGCEQSRIATPFVTRVRQNKHATIYFDVGHQNYKLNLHSAFETVADPCFGDQMLGHRRLCLDPLTRVGHVYAVT